MVTKNLVMSPDEIDAFYAENVSIFNLSDPNAVSRLPKVYFGSLSGFKDFAGEKNGDIFSCVFAGPLVRSPKTGYEPYVETPDMFHFFMKIFAVEPAEHIIKYWVQLKMLNDTCKALKVDSNAYYDMLISAIDRFDPNSRYIKPDVLFEILSNAPGVHYYKNIIPLTELIRFSTFDTIMQLDVPKITRSEFVMTEMINGLRPDRADRPPEFINAIIKVFTNITPPKATVLDNTFDLNAIVIRMYVTLFSVGDSSRDRARFEAEIRDGFRNSGNEADDKTIQASVDQFNRHLDNLAVHNNNIVDILISIIDSVDIFYEDKENPRFLLNWYTLGYILTHAPIESFLVRKVYDAAVRKFDSLINCVYQKQDQSPLRYEYISNILQLFAAVPNADVCELILSNEWMTSVFSKPELIQRVVENMKLGLARYIQTALQAANEVLVKDQTMMTRFSGLSYTEQVRFLIDIVPQCAEAKRNDCKEHEKCDKCPSSAPVPSNDDKAPKEYRCMHDLECAVQIANYIKYDSFDLVNVVLRANKLIKTFLNLGEVKVEEEPQLTESN